MKEIDARGIECPMPVIMAKREIKNGEENFYVLVNEDIAVENLKKLAKETNFDIEIEEKEDGVFKLTFNKNEENTGKDDKEESLSSSYVVVFDSDKIGDGDEDFSKSLLESFLVSIIEADVSKICNLLQQGSIFDNTKRKYHRRFEKACW